MGDNKFSRCGEKYPAEQVEGSKQRKEGGDFGARGGAEEGWGVWG